MLATDAWNDYKEELERYKQEPKNYDEPRYYNNNCSFLTFSKPNIHEPDAIPVVIEDQFPILLSQKFTDTNR